MIKLYSQLPTLDLHGLDSDYSRVLINDFVRDQYQLRQEKIVIIHGIGQGILKKVTQEVLKRNSLVSEYKIDNFNDGMTIVTLKKNTKRR